VSETPYNVAAQVERTVLSWNRSALALAANGALLAREGLTRGLIPLVVAGSAVVALGAIVWVLSATRYASTVERRASYLVAGRHGVVLGATVFVVALSVLQLALAATA
jgi:uncharacterized membrane protein YidH (DUF202 family)